MERLQRVRRDREEILRICQRHGAARVFVFGSMVHGEAGMDSDLDLLVEREMGPGGRPRRTPFWPGGLVHELEELLGMKVDIVTEGGLHERLRPRVLAEMRPL
jgi:uncharacterized protein